MSTPAPARPVKRLLFLLLLLLAPAGAATSQLPTTRPLAITHVTVIDATGAAPAADMTVLVRNGRIAAIGRSRRVVVPAGALVIDGKGRYLIPGLWDMHVHQAIGALDPATTGTAGLRSNRQYTFPMFLANGVVGVREMAGDLAVINAWRAEVASGHVLGPRIVATGQKLGDAPVVPGAPFPLRTAEDVRESVRALERAGADFVKLGKVPSHLAPILANESRRRGIPFLGHLSTESRLTTMSNLGQRSIEHLGGVLLACSATEAEDRERAIAAANPGLVVRAARRFDLLEPRPYPMLRVADSYDEAKADSLFELLARNQTWQVPTFRLLARMARLPAPESWPGPRAYYPRPLGPDTLPGPDTPAAALSPPRRIHDRLMVAVRGMRKAGVRFMTGSDTPTYYALPGFSLHDELALMVDAGFAPLEALQAATIGPAEFMNARDSLGSVEVGRVADLVLLEADPLADIRNVRRIDAVVVGGRLLTRAIRLEMLADAERLATRWRTGTATARPAGL